MLIADIKVSVHPSLWTCKHPSLCSSTIHPLIIHPSALHHLSIDPSIYNKDCVCGSKVSYFVLTCSLTSHHIHKYLRSAILSKKFCWNLSLAITFANSQIYLFQSIREDLYHPFVSVFLNIWHAPLKCTLPYLSKRMLCHWTHSAICLK